MLRRLTTTRQGGERAAETLSRINQRLLNAMFIPELAVDPLALALFGPDYYTRFTSGAAADLPVMIFLRMVVVCVPAIYYARADTCVFYLILLFFHHHPPGFSP